VFLPLSFAVAQECPLAWPLGPLPRLSGSTGRFEERYTVPPFLRHFFFPQVGCVPPSSVLEDGFLQSSGV